MLRYLDRWVLTRGAKLHEVDRRAMSCRNEENKWRSVLLTNRSADFAPHCGTCKRKAVSFWRPGDTIDPRIRVVKFGQGFTKWRQSRERTAVWSSIHIRDVRREHAALQVGTARHKQLAVWVPIQIGHAIRGDIRPLAGEIGRHYSLA